MVIEYNEKLEGRRTIEDDERKQSPCLLGRNHKDKKNKKKQKINKQTKKLNHNSIIMMNFYQLYYHNEKL